MTCDDTGNFFFILGFLFFFFEIFSYGQASMTTGKWFVFHFFVLLKGILNFMYCTLITCQSSVNLVLISCDNWERGLQLMRSRSR